MTASRSNAAAAAPGSRGRILVISYHFGLEGATGGFRWASMVNGLSALGWQVDVVTASAHVANVHHAELRRIDPVQWPVTTLAALLKVPRALVRGLRGVIAVMRSSPQAETIRPAEAPAVSELVIPVQHPSRASRLARLVDELTLMLARYLWARRAGRAGLELSRGRRYDAVIVSSPPHEHHFAGLMLADRLRIPMLADFRDTWVLALPEGFAEIPKLYRRIATLLESRIHAESSVVVHNTDRVREIVSGMPGLVAKRRVTIANGYDDVLHAVGVPDETHFEILFAGHLYPFMDVRILFRAVQALREDDAVDRAKVRLIFLGTTPAQWGRPLMEMASQYDLGDCVEIRPRVERSEAVKAQHRAAVQVVFDSPHPLSVPMKFYDYLQSGGELLLFSRPGSALEMAAGKVGARIVEPDDETGALRVLQAAYAHWQRRSFRTHHDPQGVHHRRTRIAALDALLLDVVSTPGA